MGSISMVLQNFKLIFVFDGMGYGICRTRVFLLVVDSVAAARYFSILYSVNYSHFF